MFTDTKTLFAVGAIALAGCGGPTYHVAGSDLALGADAVITVDEIDGGNIEVTVDVTNLTPPERLGSGLTSYVVWFRRPGADTHKAGAIEYDPDERRGQMRATFTDRRFDVSVTAERNRNAIEPSRFVVVEQRVSVDD